MDGDYRPEWKKYKNFYWALACAPNRAEVKLEFEQLLRDARSDLTGLLEDAAKHRADALGARGAGPSR